MQVNFIPNDSSNFGTTKNQEHNFPQNLAQAANFSNSYENLNSFLPFSHILQPFFYRVNHLEGEIQTLQA